MRKFVLAGLLTLIVAGLVAGAASAGGNCKKVTWCDQVAQWWHCPPSGPTPPHTSPPPVTPPTLPPPTINFQQPVDDFCVQTKEAGETYVQANPGAFDPGGAWYADYSQGATVNIDGHALTLQFENDNGAREAAHVPYQPGNAAAGYVSTCDPFVTINGAQVAAISTDGVYGNAIYALRGQAWTDAVNAL